MKNQFFVFSKFFRFCYLLFNSSQFTYFFLLIISATKHMLSIERFTVGAFSFSEVMWIVFFVVSFFFISLIYISTTYYIFTLQISFSKTFVNVNAHNFLGLKLLRAMNNRHWFIGKIPYKNIGKIVGGSGINTGNLKIKLIDGQEINLPVKNLERNSDFVQNFISHLSPNQLGEKLEKVSKTHQAITLKNFLNIFTILSLFFIQINQSIISDVFKSNIWNEELIGLSAYNIAIDKDNSLWVSTHLYKADAFAWHISNGSHNHWKLPKELCGDCSLLSISHDLNGNPRLINLKENGSIIYSWNGKDWRTSSTDIKFYNMSLNAHNTVLWGEQNENLAYIDFANDKQQQFPSPAEAIANNLKLWNFKVNMDGSVLAQFSEKKKTLMLYKLQNENWELVYSSSSEDNLRIQYFLDHQGKVWVLEQKTDQDNNDQFTLGFYDAETQVWIWQDVPSLNIFPHTSIFDIVIDPLNRIWISGNYYFEIDDSFVRFVKVFSWGNNGISEIEEYTDRNSNFDSIRNLAITNSGIIWAPGFDLLWIDAATEELPKPLPDWVTATQNYIDTHLQWGFLMLFILLAVVLILEIYT